MINKIVNLGISKLEAEELVKISKNIEEDYKRLLKKYPIQYLIGYVNFYGNKILVDENVLIPRYETEYLVEKTINYCKKIFKDKINILDLCTGSGAIAISLSKEVKSIVDASDISEEALNLAKQNAEINDVQINYTKSDLFKNIKDKKYDLIISNPPYIAKDEDIMESVYKYEPHIALFADDNGLYFYKKILKEAKNYLNDKFIIAFEIGCTQGEYLYEYASNLYPGSKVFLEKDLSNRNRYLFIINE